jgi:hypothetical protein
MKNLNNKAASDDGPHVSLDKAHKLSANVREEIGWKSPNEWDFKMKL